MQFSIRFKLFMSHFLAILAVSGSIGTYFYTSAIDNLTDALKSRLKYSAALLSHNFDVTKLENIQSAADTSTEKYQIYIDKLQKLVSSNPDIAFIYVMRLENQHVEFVLDSDDEEPAMPGEPYEEYIPELMHGFDELSVDQQITTDKWGSFMSGYAPILGGEYKYLVGIDMRADEVSGKLAALKKQGMISLALSILFAYVFASVLSHGMLKRIKTLHQRCLDIAPLKEKADSKAGDELDSLNRVFDYMLSFLQASHDDLEKLVQKRTFELNDANERLQEEVEERRRMEKVLKESARTDYLTGLLNRREITNKLHAAESQAKLSGRIFSVVLLDIDKFKSVNTHYGHDVGDKALRTFARTLLQFVREGDVTGRWGGEEFVLLLPNTSEREAVEQADKIRHAISETTFQAGDQDLRISASCGVAEYKNSQDIETTLRRADQALRAAKQNGRNQVLAADLSPTV